MNKTRFDWDSAKDAENQKKHGVPFSLAQYAFADPNRVIAEDLTHRKLRNATFVYAKLTVVSSPSALTIAAVSSNPWCRLLAERKGNI